MKYIANITMKNCAAFLSGCALMLSAPSATAQKAPVYKDATQSIDVRVKDLISKLTLEEKVSLLGYRSKAVPRLDIPAYNWWNEGLHGVARAGEATIFPQAIGMAATFNEKLVDSVADAYLDRSEGKIQRIYITGAPFTIYGPYLLDTQYQYFSRPKMGPRTGDLWRRPIFDRPYRDSICKGNAG
jgi:beta-glucosidase